MNDQGLIVGPSALKAPFAVSRVRVVRSGGPHRFAYLPAQEAPVTFGHNGRVGEHYGYTTENNPDERPTTLDFLVASAAGCLAGTFGGALQTRGIAADDDHLQTLAEGEIELSDRVLVLTRIVIEYRLRAPADQRADAERVLGFHARFCPVSRSIAPCVEILTKLAFEAE